MSNLFWFQSWYVKHSFDAKIDVSFITNKDGGWIITVNLRNTKFNSISDYSYSSDLKGLEWYKVELKDHIFIAEGNFTQLDYLIGKFRDLIGEGNTGKIKQDNYWDKEIQHFIFEKHNELITFLHYTCSNEVAEKIIQNGFRFYDFDKTAHEAKNHSTELNYFHYLHKQFGDFIVVISISRKLYYNYLNKLNLSNSTISRVEEILTESPVFINENSDNVYTLHRNYIKGYFNYFTKEIVKNNNFDPYYDSDQFLKNFQTSKTI